MSAQRRVFPESFKREAVDRVANSGLTAGAVARELGLHETVLRRWMTQFGAQGAAHTPCRSARTGRPAASSPDDEQPSRLSDRAQQAGPQLRGGGSQPDLARRPDPRVKPEGRLYIPTGEGWLYLAAILDMHTRKIVGWSMRRTLHTEIALDALNMAVDASGPRPA